MTAFPILAYMGEHVRTNWTHSTASATEPFTSIQNGNSQHVGKVSKFVCHLFPCLNRFVFLFPSLSLPQTVLGWILTIGTNWEMGKK